MAIKHGDLRNAIRKNISIDEFEPKTGSVEDVIVVGFYVNEEEAGDDLFEFINTSAFDVNDVEVSPNTDENNYYVVFVELKREPGCLETIRNLVKDMENATGRLAWQASTHLTDEFYPLGSAALEQYVIQDPADYVTREEWEKQNAEREQAEEAARLEEEQNSRDNQIMEFLKDTDLKIAALEENNLHISGVRDSAQLNVVAFGPAEQVMTELGINELPVKNMDWQHRQLDKMLGETRAVPIGDYVVIYHPNKTHILVGETCTSSTS
jgi:hypothetical protein